MTRLEAAGPTGAGGPGGAAAVGPAGPDPAGSTAGLTASAAAGGTASVVLAGVGLHKSFGLNAALNGADIAVGGREIVAVMGPSGSGKSTLLHCLGGILVPDAGQVRYRGQDLAALTDGARSALRRREFGFVFQFGQLVPELTCVQNVALPLRLGRTRRREAERVARRWLERLEVADVADLRPGETSGGQAQRVAIARALVGEPAVVFADEPTGALDSLAGERVMQLLVDASRQAGAAVVLVTHEPRVAAYADREVVVRDGRSRGVGALEPVR
jgi:putative ABC transport system ATP-binding protein